MRKNYLMGGRREGREERAQQQRETFHFLIGLLPSGCRVTHLHKKRENIL
jgi:hypothetical protein